jgi:acetyl esterase/lipase
MRTFTYKTVGEIPIQADVYRADDARVRPVVVWIHGGALVMGSRKGVPGRILDLCRKEGYCLVSIDYRLAPEVKIAAVIEDLQDALRWVREKGPALFAADPKRLVVAGASAGGYLTMMAGCSVKPPPTALVAYAGYGDVDGDWYTKPSAHYRASAPLVPREEAYRAVGQHVLTGTEGDTPAGIARGRYYLYLRQNGLWTKEVTGMEPGDPRLDRYCPVRSISPDYPALLMVHGTADTDVPYEKSAEMARELARRGIAHELVTVPGGDHGLGGESPQVTEAHARALAFIRDHLKTE